MPAITQHEDGTWHIDRNWLTPERIEIMDRLEELHERDRQARRKETQDGYGRHLDRDWLTPERVEIVERLVGQERQARRAARE